MNMLHHCKGGKRGLLSRKVAIPSFTIPPGSLPHSRLGSNLQTLSPCLSTAGHHRMNPQA